MSRLIGVLLIGIIVASCDAASGENDTPMGSGGTCIDNLSAVVDESYLAENGLEPRDSDAATIAVGGAIAEVCTDGPATMTIDDAAQKVMRIIRTRYTSD